jgi:hypothetical protein
MGLTGFLKKKLTETPEEKADRLSHEAQVKKIRREAFYKAELEAAAEHGRIEGAKAGYGEGKKKGGLLTTIGRAAEGALVGVNKGAKMFNDGMGIEGLGIPKQTDELVIPKGNNDLFSVASTATKKKRKNQDDIFW